MTYKLYGGLVGVLTGRDTGCQLFYLFIFSFSNFFIGSGWLDALAEVHAST